MSPSRIDLLQGTLDLIVLERLKAAPAHGWALTQSIQALTRGALDVNYGSIYPTLRRLEANGWVTAWWGVSDNNRRARYYEITFRGRRQLRAERSHWRRFSAALALILEAD
jgi:transcriptional regulator